MDKAKLDPMQRCMAESEIRNVVARLGHLADDGDIDEYLSLIAEDASWGGAGRAVRTGHADLRARVIEDRTAGIQGPGTATRHLNTTLWVEVDDEDHAHAESYFLYITNANGGTAGSTARDTAPIVQLTGRYRDTFVRVDGRWRMQTRTIVRDVN
jgi:hypothetical protein